MILVIALYALLTILIYWVYWRWKHRRLLELAAKLPGPPALPIIGNALIFIAKPEGNAMYFQKIVLIF